MTPKQRGANYKTVEQAMRDRLPFVHRSVRGERTAEFFYIYSYNTLVAYIALNDPSVFWLTDTRYSVTTSKHMGIVRRAWDLDKPAPAKPVVVVPEPRPAKGFIGSQEEAEIAANLTGWSVEVPAGWEFMGSGCSRRAYLAPSGVVYKVTSNYDDANDNEFLSVMTLIVSGVIPEGWDVPMTYRYRVSVGGKEKVVIAMENLGHTEVSVYNGAQNLPPVPAGFKSHFEVASNVFGVFDPHGGNIRKRADGTLVCIDLGFSNAAGNESWS